VAEARAVVWSEPALADAEAAYSYFLDRSRTYADRFLVELERAADSLATFSERGRVVPELDLPNVRELIVEKHRMVYDVTPGAVRILRLIHGRQDFKSSWKSRPQDA
jgi:toxin ParE1/3/4